jgi:hypothetical protein
MLNFSIASPVYFQNINLVAAGDGLTDTADATRLRSWLLFAIQASGQDAGCGGFSHAAGTGEKICMGNATGAYGITQGAGNRILPNQA